MRKPLFGGGALALAILALASASAEAAPAKSTAVSAPSTAGCANPAVSQAFLSWGDQNWYAMVPGESLDNFAGTGWTLSGGATIKQQTLADGQTGSVLDMPGGSTAVSPEMCIGNGYPLARSVIRFTSGKGGGVAFTPYDLTTGKHMGSMKLNAKDTAWAASSPVNVLPGAINSWHIMQFTYVADGNGEYQIYDFGVDPHMAT